MGLREKYEAYHKCRYTEDAIEAAVHLSARYIVDRYLPDKAIDLIDEAGSRARIVAFRTKKEKETCILSKFPADYWQEIRTVQSMHEMVMALLNVFFYFCAICLSFWFKMTFLTCWFRRPSLNTMAHLALMIPVNSYLTRIYLMQQMIMSMFVACKKLSAFICIYLGLFSERLTCYFLF